MSDQYSAFYTCERTPEAGNLWYFAPANRVSPPYKNQRHVDAILDIAADGTLAGVELIDDMPAPPEGPAIDETVRNAIAIVRAAIQHDFIVESCAGFPTIGCASCEMTALDRQLEALSNEYNDESPFAERDE